MTDEAPDVPVEIERTDRRAPVSRETERRNTRIGTWLATTGVAFAFYNMAKVGVLTAIPAIVSLAFVGCGCALIVPEVFKPLLNKALDQLHLFRRGP